MNYDLESLLLEGDVDFSASKVNDLKSRLYVVTFDDGPIESIDVLVGDSVITLKEVRSKSVNCPCN